MQIKTESCLQKKHSRTVIKENKSKSKCLRVINHGDFLMLKRKWEDKNQWNFSCTFKTKKSLNLFFFDLTEKFILYVLFLFLKNCHFLTLFLVKLSNHKFPKNSINSIYCPQKVISHDFCGFVLQFSSLWSSFIVIFASLLCFNVPHLFPFMFYKNLLISHNSCLCFHDL